MAKCTTIKTAATITRAASQRAEELKALIDGINVPITKNVGDICFYDSEKAKLSIVDFDKWNADPTAYPDTRYTPIGVVVIPASHDVYGTGECAVMALKAMSYSAPDDGSASNSGVCWGQYNVDTELPNLNVFVTTGTTASPTTEATGTASSVYLPCDRYTYTQCPTDPEAFYASSSSSPAGPSPYLEDGSRNPAYYQTESPSSTLNALADFDGIGNSKVLWGLATAQEDWKTAEAIDNQTGEGYSPAACCCWRFHTEGTEQGDWYLPACGELGYIFVRAAKIDNIISALNDAYGSQIGATLPTNDYFIWSSSEYSSTNASGVVLSGGTGAIYGAKGDSYPYARAFLRV